MAVVQLRKTVHGMWAALSKCVEQKNMATPPQFFGTLVSKSRILGGPVDPWLEHTMLDRDHAIIKHPPMFNTERSSVLRVQALPQRSYEPLQASAGPALETRKNGSVITTYDGVRAAQSKSSKPSELNAVDLTKEHPCKVDAWTQDWSPQSWFTSFYPGDTIDKVIWDLCGVFGLLHDHCQLYICGTLLKHDQSLRQVRMGFESRPPIVLCRVLREFHQAQAGG